MSFNPVSRTVPQYSVDGDTIAAGFYLKGYITGTTTPLSMATDDTGGTLLAKCRLNTAGYPLSNEADDTTVFIPHFDAKYKLILYLNAADADANTTANAVWVVDAIPINDTLALAGTNRIVATTEGADVLGSSGTAAILDVVAVSTESALMGLRGSTNGGIRIVWNESASQALLVQTTPAGVQEDTWVQMDKNDAVKLFFNGTLRLQTTNTGADILGSLFDIDNSSADANTAVVIRNSVGGSALSQRVTTGDLRIHQLDSAGMFEDIWIDLVRNGAVSLYFNGIKEFETKSGGVIVDDQLEVAGFMRYSGTVQTLTGAGAVNITTAITEIVTTGADALTLVDGAQGQRKYIVMKTDGGAGTLTPDNLGNGTTITFDDVGDSADLIFTNAAWHFIGGTATLA